MKDQLLIIGIICVLILIIFVIKFIFTTKEHFKIVTSLPDNKDLIIVTSHFQEDLKWLENSKNSVVLCSKTKNSPLCHQDKNLGREAASYIKFILDNYNYLPEHIAFIHGHEHAWHQDYHDILKIINECAKYKTYGFISINNHFINDRNIVYNDAMKYMHSIWDEVFRPHLKRDAPNYIFQDCCAQFIVSKERILRHSKETYQYWYEYMMNDPLGDGGFTIGMVFEFLWPIIFGEPDIVNMETYYNSFNCF